MRKVIFPAAMLLIVGLASCKKDYTCTCTTTDSSGGTATSSVTIHATKKDAKEVCNATATSTSGGSSASVSCSID